MVIGAERSIANNEALGWNESGSRSYHLSEDQAGAREKPPGLG